MSLETYLDSGYQLAVPLVARTSGGGGFLESLSSCTSLQKDGQSRAGVVSHRDLSFGNLPNSIARMVQLNANLVSGDMNSTVLGDTTSSGPSIGASSLVTDANSPLSVAYLQKSGNPNMDSYIDLASSRLSFNLNPSVIDGSSIAQEAHSHLDQNCRQGRKRMQQQQEASSTGTTQTHPVSRPTGINQEPGALTQMRKKPRLDINKEDVLHHQIVQKLLQRQDHVQMQYHNPQLQELIRQHRLQSQQKQQILQSVPQLRGVHSQQQQERRHHLQQQVPHQVSAVHPFDGGICSRRLMQYIYHLRHRPPDNNIAYWRKFVTEYYAPCAKKRWCLSLYDNIGQHALGVFSQTAMEAWHCDICGSKSGKGFEAIYEILPRLNKMKYESGVIDELLFLDLPRECRFHSGLMMLEYGKAVQENVYEQFRVVREGQLRVIFSHDLKILSWEFCARHHEELLPCRLVAPQVNQLVQAANKYQRTINDNAFDRLSPKDLQSKCNMFLTAGRQLTRNLELLLVNDLGFSKRYLRCLQIAEVVSSMKDLMTFSHENNVGPIESLKNIFREDTKTKIQMKWVERTEQRGSDQGQLTEIDKLMVLHPDQTSNINENSHMTDGGLLKDSGTASLALTNYYQKLLRQNSASHNVGTVKQDPPSMSCSNQKAQKSLTNYYQKLLRQNSASHNVGTVKQDPPSMSCSNQKAQKSLRQSSASHNIGTIKQEPPSMSCSNPKASSPVLGSQYPSTGLFPSSPDNDLSISQSSHSSKDLQQHMIHKLLQELVTNSKAGVQNVNGRVKEEVPVEFNGSTSDGLTTRSRGTIMVSNGLGLGKTKSTAAVTENVLCSVLGRTNNVNSASNSSSSRVCGSGTLFKREPDLPEKFNLPIVQEMARDFTEIGVLNGDWKA